jgi:predicted ATPase/class 3 adenylate cyclase
MMAELPSGTVTFLFTDIEGSTRLLKQLGERYDAVLLAQQRILRDAFAAHRGREVDTQGDSSFVAFQRAQDAVAAAVQAQRELAAHPWPNGVQVKVRMGLHTSEPRVGQGRYFGFGVHRAARISTAGHGGQVLLSNATRELVEDDLPPDVRLLELGAYQLKDVDRPERLCQLAIDGLPSEFPPLKIVATVPPEPLSLPTLQLTRLVGREREVAAVSELLRIPTVRLLTISGPGGVGKTRLAIAVLSEVAEDFTDGALFVSLGALTDSSLVVPTIAHAVGMRDREEEPLSGLKLHLRDRRQLLLLDNFEQVAEAAPALVDLLGACIELKIAVTSRARLRASGEHEFPLAPLSLPDPEEHVAAELLPNYGGVALFIERARAVRPDLDVGEAGLRAIAEICIRVDGLPLAIELAAARVKLLTPEAMRARLERRLELLTAGPRDLPARQQTLRDTIDWSHELLDDRERTLFRRLAPFAGGCTLGAAEFLGNLRGDVSGVVDALASLVDKNLLQQVTGSDGEARLVMLETIREYALDRLANSADEEETRRAHAAYFLNLAEQAKTELAGPNQASWLNRLDADYGNLREALRFSQEQGDAETGLRLAGALWGFWLERGHLSEGRRWLGRALDAGTGSSAAIRANALKGAGILAHYQGDYGEAQALCGASLALYRELADKHGIADALSALALATRTSGEFAEAEAMFEEAHAIFIELEDKQGVARTLDRLGIAIWFEGDDERAHGVLTKSLAAFRELGDTEGVGLALVDLGLVALSQGDYARAEPLLEESLAALKEVGDRRNVCKALYAFGDLAAGRRDYARAVLHYEESLGISIELGIPWFTALCLERLAGVAAATGNAERAARVFGTAGTLREAIAAPMPAYFRALYKRDLADTRARLGEERFETAWSEGHAMPLEKAISTA